ncbi:MAG TPA: glucose 1-dehydrogenase [Burkholderiales bacterium]|nr:glucose 1-dehydrogenase [Burkholderiales bacterium]
MNKAEERPVAFVTGASQGLGAQIAVALARDGCDVAVSSRRIERLSDTLGRIEAAGARGVPVELDVRQQASMERAMGEVISAFGRADVLVNNAAVTLRRAALEMTREEWDELMSVNLKGVFFMSQLMGRHLVARKRPGCVINLASTHGLVGYPGRSAYGVAKAGIVQMTRMLAIEWAEHGIRVNAVAPGTVDTPSRADFFAANPDAKQAMTGRIPFRRFGTPDEVAAAVRYLASPQAAYMTGQTLVLDGGLTAY